MYLACLALNIHLSIISVILLFFLEKKKIIETSISPIVILMLKPLQLILDIGHLLAKLLSELTQDISLALKLVPLGRGQATLL